MVVQKELLLNLWRSHFGLVPTKDQAEAMDRISDFLSDKEAHIFILRGYAGTGKTSLIASLVKALHILEEYPILIAPTGRAAKVFSHYSRSSATTIHRTIYSGSSVAIPEEDLFNLKKNRMHHSLFIVDEASMISNIATSNCKFGAGNLLDDLTEYVFSRKKNKIIFIGDVAQLPPVGEYHSVALDSEYFEIYYGKNTFEYDLRGVVRQSQNSGVLYNATKIRLYLAKLEFRFPLIEIAGYTDIKSITGGDLIECLTDCYREVGITETVVITRSNKRANRYNNGIRKCIFDREEELCRGDLLMIAKNNYFWTDYDVDGEERTNFMAPFSFIANGDIAEVVKIWERKEAYGFNFARVTLSFPDYQDFEIDTWLILETLQSESPSLSDTQFKTLIENILERPIEEFSKKRRKKILEHNVFYNALQIKYAYAITCHKAQGGQWRRVFLDTIYYPDSMLRTDDLRWLYTALTRTSEKLYLVNWIKEYLKID